VLLNRSLRQQLSRCSRCRLSDLVFQVSCPGSHVRFLMLNSVIVIFKITACGMMLRDAKMAFCDGEVGGLRL
jgi:hypothetical protein